MRLWSRLRRRTFWTTGLYRTATPGWPDGGRLIRTFGAGRLLRLPYAAHTQADPFVFVTDDRLYLFLEIVRANRAGVIKAWSSADLDHWTAHGVVLGTATHLSYPNILRIGEETYLLPESKAAGGVTLYRFNAFPYGLTPMRRIVDGPVNDPTPFRHGDHWYLFATTPAGLELYVSDDILNAPFRRHPIGVIEADIRHARCGGPILVRDGRLFRPAQDGRRRYGGSLDLREIVTLTPTAYVERAAGRAILPQDRFWNRAGGHHLSSVEFAGGTVYAVDGQGWEAFHHKFTGRIAMGLDRLRLLLAARHRIGATP